MRSDDESGLRSDSVSKLLVAVLIALASAAVAAVIWGIVIWRLGIPYGMPFLVSLKTARAARVFMGRYLLTVALVFIIAWLPAHVIQNRRRSRRAPGTREGGAE